jgi:hypothetical protein
MMTVDQDSTRCLTDALVERLSAKDRGSVVLVLQTRMTNERRAQVNREIGRDPIVEERFNGIWRRRRCNGRKERQMGMSGNDVLYGF